MPCQVNVRGQEASNKYVIAALRRAHRLRKMQPFETILAHLSRPFVAGLLAETLIAIRTYFSQCRESHLLRRGKRGKRNCVTNWTAYQKDIIFTNCKHLFYCNSNLKQSRCCLIYVNTTTLSEH